MIIVNSKNNFIIIIICFLADGRRVPNHQGECGRAEFGAGHFQGHTQLLQLHEQKVRDFGFTLTLNLEVELEVCDFRLGL